MRTQRGFAFREFGRHTSYSRCPLRFGLLYVPLSDAKNWLPDLLLRVPAGYSAEIER